MNSDTRVLVAPRIYAFIAAFTYFALMAAYIHFSADIVVALAQGSIERMVQMQKMKGIFVVFMTALAFYGSMRWVSRRTAKASAELHDTRERWLEAETKSTSAIVACSIAHDVANLLTVLRLNVEKVKRNGATPEALAKFEQVNDRLMELVKRLRGASSSLFEQNPVAFDFCENVRETIALMRSHICCENVDIEFVGETRMELQGYPVLVHQLVMNLMINAAEATSRKGRIRFTLSPLSHGVSIVAEDDGPGIAPSLREKVLGAFFTTKSTGTGLGLTSVRTCVEIHDGTLAISDSRDLGGAKFSIELPNLSGSRVEELRHPEKRAPEFNA